MAINALYASFKKSFARKALGGRKNCADELFFVTLWWISEEVHHEYRLRPDIALCALFVVMRLVKQMPALLAPSLHTTPHRIATTVQVSCSALLRKRTSSSGTILANVLEDKEHLGSMVIVSAFEARRTIGTNPEGLGT